MESRRRAMLVLLPAMLVLGCAGLPGSEPLQVSLAGVEPLPGEGLELRFAVRLRVQNPNEQPLNFSGVSVQLELRGMDFASGVSDVSGTVPRFGETVITVPVTASAFAMARQALSLASAERVKLDFVARGRLANDGFGTRFESRGAFDLPR